MNGSFKTASVIPLKIHPPKDLSPLLRGEMPLIVDEVIYYQFVSGSFVTSCGSMLADPGVLEYQKQFESFHRYWLATLAAIYQHTAIQHRRCPKCCLQENLRTSLAVL